ncbi:Enolase-phosphatase E1 [Halotydeus destructor]|nr:Enolase-phosphatase E1 [Halotydeus destructor]
MAELKKSSKGSLKEIEKQSSKPSLKEQVKEVAKEPIKIRKPNVIITRIYGVTSSAKFGNEMYDFYRTKLEQYLTANWTDSTIQRIVKDLREQANKDAVAELPRISEDTVSPTEVINSVINFIEKKDALAKKTKPKHVYPMLVELKSLIIGLGMEKGDLVTQVYSDVMPAFESWLSAKIKIYTISSGPSDGQLAFFAHTNSGDLSKMLTDGISTTNPTIKGTDVTINYRNVASRVVKEEAGNILLLTDKLAEANLASKSSINVILITRDGFLGHAELTKELQEEIADYLTVSSLKDILFEEA